MDRPRGEAFAYGIVMQLRAANSRGLAPDRLFDLLVETLYLVGRNGTEPRDPAWEEREARFHEIRREIGDDLMRTYSRMTGLMLIEAARRHGDLFGEINDALGLDHPAYQRNATPYEASRATAEIAVTGLREQIAAGRAIDIQDPNSGTGGMLIAIHDALVRMEPAATRSMHITAWDPDPLCWMMTYVACWIYGIPATLVLGDASARERIRQIDTPAKRHFSARPSGN